MWCSKWLVVVREELEAALLQKWFNRPPGPLRLVIDTTLNVDDMADLEVRFIAQVGVAPLIINGSSLGAGHRDGDARTS